jgi:hypothetical protein
MYALSIIPDTSWLVSDQSLWVDLKDSAITELNTFTNEEIKSGEHLFLIRSS